ncbi:MAG TPA: patatin-like phospholipase family protein, partial [Lysobacter sp.]
MKVIVMFGGGGALGAFDCGVWNALVPRLRDADATLVGVGGASIGAINAACLARHGQDLWAGANELDALWRGTLVTPSLPFTGFAGGREQASWNGVLTGLLAGTRQLYRVDPWHWHPLAGLDRRARPLMDRAAMWGWLERRIGTLATRGGDAPLLCVPAVDVASGELVVFDSDRSAITAAHIAASSAIPLLFEPVVIDGRTYWDGDITREAALPLMLDRLRARGRLDAGAPGETVLICVDHMSRSTPRLPQSGLELAHRALELLLHGKMRPPADCLEGIDRVIHIARDALPHDAVSGQFDYSPERIG